MSQIPRHYLDFIEKYPEFGAAYKRLGDAALEAGPLGRKEAELIKIGISIGARMESAVKSHCRKAVAAGANGDEIRHAAMLAVTTVGFPSMMAGLKWVEEVLDQ